MGRRIAFVILAAIAIFATGFALADCRAQAQINDLLQSQTITHEEIVVERARVRTLTTALSEAEEEQQVLRELVASLRDKPVEVRYIVRTETVLQPVDPVVITPDLPEDHQFIVEPGLVVAKFSQEEEGFRFETYGLEFNTSVVLGERDTAVLLQGRSTYDDHWLDLATELQVTKIREQQLFEPHIGIGASASFPVPTLSASLVVSTLHPWEDTDLLVGRVGGNNQVFQVGLDPIAYNLGGPLPALTDLWIAPGVTFDTRGQVSGTATVFTKF